MTSLTMTTKTTKTTKNEYIGRCEMGYCGYACREFINNLPDHEKNQWSMLNIRALKSNNNAFTDSIFLQDVRGPKITYNHVFMIKSRHQTRLVSESRFFNSFEIYDPLYDKEYENLLYYLCFFYTKLYFNDDLVIGSTVDFEIQFQKDYNNTYWTTSTYGNLQRFSYPTSDGMRFNVKDMSEGSGIDIFANAKKEMNEFNTALSEAPMPVAQAIEAPMPVAQAIKVIQATTV